MIPMATDKTTRRTVTKDIIERANAKMILNGSSSRLLPRVEKTPNEIKEALRKAFVMMSV
jgi:hypothetical protein